MQKLYCYVDESGQDTKGVIFVVSVIVVGEDREELLQILSTVESSTGHTRKWSKSRPERRYVYIELILKEPKLAGKLFFGDAGATLNYVGATITVTAEAILMQGLEQDEYKASVFVDGLSRPEEKSFAAALRQRGIRTDKIRGLADEENALIRLADALSGFLREALYEENAKLNELLQNVIQDQTVIAVPL